MRHSHALLANIVGLSGLGLFGGCTWSPPQNVNINAEIPDGGRPGDELWVSGALGGSRAGFSC
jgi:hypothetical protein